MTKKMPHLFYGSAIQGAHDRGARASLHQALIVKMRALGFHVLSEHTGGRTREESATLLERSIGPLPPPGTARRQYVRRRMIEFIEGPIAGAIFEVSEPSLGTGVEIAHAYLRPRLSLPPIPIMTLYQRGYWTNGLSTMISGTPLWRFRSSRWSSTKLLRTPASFSSFS